jgi:hypothetical protein
MKDFIFQEKRANLVLVGSFIGYGRFFMRCENILAPAPASGRASLR